MMAFETLEPFGSLPMMFGFGQVCSVLANLKRDPKERPEPYRASDFMPALAEAMGRSAVEKAEPMLLEDPEEQSRLIKSAIFGVKDDG